MTRVPSATPWRMLMLSSLLAWTGLSTAPARAQPAGADVAGLRERVERRYDILPLHDGVALKPRTRSDVRSIEIAAGTIAIDGQPVTGAELRGRLGNDADLILQITYLDENGRRTLSGSSATSPASAPPSVPSATPDVVTPPSPPPPPAEPERRRSRREHRRGDDRIRFGGSIDVEEGEVVTGDVVAIGGSIEINGHVTGDVVAVGGSLDLGPKAIVEGDAVAVGGNLDRAPGARVDGEVQEVSIARGLGGLKWGGASPKEVGREVWRPFSSVFSLLSTLVRLGALCLLAALVLLFGRDYVARVGERAVAEPLKAGAIGLLAQALFVPVLVVTIVFLAVTIIGIPLLLLVPFAVLVLMVFALAGFTAVASHVGEWCATRLGWTGYGPYAMTIGGIVLMALPLILAKLVGLGGGPLWLMSYGLSALGFLAEYVAWTIGMGAVALSRFSPRGSVPTSVAA